MAKRKNKVLSKPRRLRRNGAATRAPKQDRDPSGESEDLYRAFITQTAVGIARSDLKGRFVFVNQKFADILGYKRSELIGKRIRDLTHRDHLTQTQKLFRRLMDTGAPYYLEKRYICKNGSAIWLNVSASPVLNTKGKVQAVIAVIRDISERKQAQLDLENAKLLLEKRVEERTQELIAANKELENEISRRRGLEGEILEVSDREQQRLGEELHDGICQHLTAVAFLAHSTALRLKNHRVITVDDIEKITELVNEAANDARDIARTLHTLEVGAAELERTLQDLATRKFWTTPCWLEMEAPIPIQDDAAASHLYRIVREAIINANKHARAREITLRVSASQDGTVVSVTDDGTGIQGKGNKKTQGMGFHIMKYRARAIGARLEIESVKPHGTRVACYLPRP